MVNTPTADHAPDQQEMQDQKQTTQQQEEQQQTNPLKTKESPAVPVEEKDTTMVPVGDEDKSKEKKEGEEEEEEEKPTVTIGQLFQYADTTDNVLMIAGTIVAFINGAGMPAFSEVFGRMVDELQKSGANLEDVMAELAGVLSIIGGVVFCLSWFQVTTFTIAAERQTKRIREKYFEATLRQELGFHDEQKPGGLSARLFGDITVVRNGINDKLVAGVYNFGMFLFGFGFGFYRSWRLTLVMFGTLPFIAGAGAMFAKILEDSTKEARSHYAKAGDISDEVMKNIRTVQAFGGEAREVKRFEAALEEAAGHGVKKEFSTVAGVGVTYGVMFASYSLAFWFASWLVNEGYATVGEITSVFFAVLMGSFGLGLIFPSISALAEAEGAAFKVWEVLERESKIDPFTAGEKLVNLDGKISFKNISFSYPTRMDEVLFRDVSFDIKAGDHIAFSGQSGCGKSTFIGLVQRLYDPLEGEVQIDGVDLKKIDLDWWRSQIGVVQQEPTLFSGTIEDNILMGKPDATHEEVVAACKKSNIHDTIMLFPDKYQTQVGSAASQLSGGQKQRMAIARALIRKPRLLILDEATSALDRQSEIEVQRAIDELMRSKDGKKLTILVIAHRLATIRNVDKIYFIENDGVEGSRISESGTFDELMKKNGPFAAMASRQSKSMGTLEEDSEQLKKEQEERLKQESFDPDKFIPEEKLKEKKKDPLQEELDKELEEVDSSMSRVYNLMPTKWPVYLGLLGSMLAGGIYPFYAVVFAKVLEIIGRNDRDQITLWACMFVVIAVGALVGWCLQGFYGYAGEALTVILRRRAFEAILRQDMKFFDMPGRDPGSMQKLLSGDCEAVHQLWGPSIGTKIQVTCNLVAGLAIGFYYSWKLALVTLSCVPVMIVTGAVQQMMVAGFGSQAGEQTATVVTESLHNIRTVTAFNIHKRQIELYAKSLEENEASGIKLAIGSGAIFGLSQFSFYGVFSLALWYGGKLMSQGELTFFDVIVSSMAILMGAIGAGEAGGWAAKLADSSAASARVFALIDRNPEIDIRKEGDKQIGNCDIKFDNIHFIYPARPEATVLKGFSSEVPAGRTLGLMGSTGCGKSTLIQLLLRSYNPKEGQILVDGKELSTIDLKTWRDQIACVLQEPSLFSGTIRENIRYTNPDASDEEIEKYAKLASVHDDIMNMDKKYETEVGYSGRNLSGGQKQRVALARALLSKKKVLLLDEATSALDQGTEAKVQDGLGAYLKEHPMTVVSIAHRLTTIRYSDKIMLLDNGVVLEEGNHDQLMAKNGEYKKRWDNFMAGQSH